jgi:hypothetical protein
MMGQQRRTESLFYYFRLEEQIPADHLLRLIDGYVDFSFVREQLKDFYSPTGRPSIDPEVLLRLLVVGYRTEPTLPCRLPGAGLARLCCERQLPVKQQPGVIDIFDVVSHCCGAGCVVICFLTCVFHFPPCLAGA